MATILNVLGPSGVVRTHELPDHAHVVQFYTEDSFLLDGLSTFFANALKSGESVVCVMTKVHRRGMVKRLSAHGVDVAELIKLGRLTILDCSDALQKFMDAGVPNRQRFLREFSSVIRKAESAAAVRDRRVVVFGEMVAVLWAQKKYDAAIQLERLWNELARTNFFYLRCAYPVKGFKGKMKGEPYATVCAEHSVVIPA